MIKKKTYKSRWVVVEVVGERRCTSAVYSWGVLSLTCGMAFLFAVVSDCPSRVSVSQLYSVCVPDHTAVTEGPLCSSSAEERFLIISEVVTARNMGTSSFLCDTPPLPH